MQDRMRIVRGVSALALLALASGCASIRDHRGYIVDGALLDSVQPGLDNKESVEKALGRPTFVSQFGDRQWYYVSMNTKQAPFTRPRTQNELVVKVDFDPAGNVRSVERSGMEHVVRLSPDHDKTPTLGRDRSFFEDLFGNIGAVGAVPGATPGSGRTGGGPNGS
ncbi:MAG: outer membrane protein assembly factor BamE [Sphingomonadales bacterium]|nr:outer membrane protein assembly factor BamE [Sphingomonadales bacterium]MDE2570553.1 outer membrane protein assembly factor BamE [Sphingomonadales bacterium]